TALSPILMRLVAQRQRRTDMLRRLQASNFRLLENFDIRFSPNITVLIGANNAGKSNILDAILFLKEGFVQQTHQVMNNRGALDRIVSRHDVSRQVRLATDVTIGETVFGLQTTFSSLGLIAETLAIGERAYHAQW